MFSLKMINIYQLEEKKLRVLSCLSMSDLERVFQINGPRYYEPPNEAGAEAL